MDRTFNLNFDFDYGQLPSDLVKFSMMFVVSQWLESKSLANTNWILSSLGSLLGLTLYHFVVRKLVNTDRAGELKTSADDWVKFGTMLTISRLTQGKSIFDQTWAMATVAVLIGFTVYDVFVSKYLQGSQVATHPKLISSIDDIAKVGTMMVVSHMLTCGSLFDPKWALTVIATLVGFVSYDLLLSDII